MRLLQIISHYIPAYHLGGQLKVAHGLGKALTRAGHEVIVVTTNLGSGISSEELLSVPTMIDGVTVYYEPVRVPRQLVYAPTIKQRLSQVLPEADALIIHGAYLYPNWIAAKLGSQKEVPMVVFPHGMLDKRAIAGKGFLRKSLWLNLMEKQNYRHVGCFAFNAEEERSASLFADRGFVISSSPDEEELSVSVPNRDHFRSQYDLPPDAFCCLFLGRIDRKKALDVLIPTFAKFARRQDKAYLFIAGPDYQGYRLEIERLVKQLGIEKRVIFTGMLSGAEKVSILRNSDVFVLPSYYEGLPIALLEAMYVGLPVIVSNRVGIWQMIQSRHAGLVVSPDEAELSAALDSMLDQGWRQELAGNARELVLSEFSWDKSALRLTQYLRESGARESLV
jgi:glycosyltransferase involved in cell wall biosynthesis